MFAGLIEHAPYELRPRRPGLKPRRGALIRYQGGVADLHPWPELGDLTLDEELSLLARGQTSPRSARTLFFAELEGAARRERRNLFSGLEIPPSHFFAGRLADFDPARAQGFSEIKLKLGAGDSPLDLVRTDPFRLRLDFNGAFASAEAFVAWLRRCPADVLERIDFIEDPFAYEAQSWKQVDDLRLCRLALDRKKPEWARQKVLPGVEVLVIKPALEDPEPWLQRASESIARVVFTHGLDHPVGQLFAAYSAALAFKAHPLLIDSGGLLPPGLYEADAFSEAIAVRGRQLIPPSGPGIGFEDDLLSRLPWKALPQT